MTAELLRARCGRVLAAALLTLGFAATVAAADVCVSIDEARDTFSSQDRRAAVLLVARQFEIEGEHVVQAPCGVTYVLSHIQLGPTVSITLVGPQGRRDATAAGMQDVPELYGQLVRALLRGVPMASAGVVNRDNVAAPQAEEPKRVRADSLVYFRLGYAGTFAEQTMGAPSVAFLGYRRELDAFGIDVSVLNISHTSSTIGNSSAYYNGGWDRGVNSSTWLKLMFLRFTAPRADRSLYVGGGVSWTTIDMNADASSWEGNGLQGELTAGYELGRSSSIRTFLQTDIGLPIYKLHGERYTGTSGPPYYTPPTYVAAGARYAPTLTLSLGIGWQRGRT